MLRFILLIVFALFLAGCTTVFGRNSYFARQDAQYLTAREATPVRLPPGLNSAALNDDYNIPPIVGNPPTQPVSKLPPGSLIAGIESGSVPKSVLKDKTTKKEAPSLNSVNNEPDLAPNNPFQKDSLTAGTPAE